LGRAEFDNVVLSNGKEVNDTRTSRRPLVPPVPKGMQVAILRFMLEEARITLKKPDGIVFT
jgi:hypothetical protein